MGCSDKQPCDNSDSRCYRGYCCERVLHMLDVPVYSPSITAIETLCPVWFICPNDPTKCCLGKSLLVNSSKRRKPTYSIRRPQKAVCPSGWSTIIGCSTSGACPSGLYCERSVRMCCPMRRVITRPRQGSVRPAQRVVPRNRVIVMQPKQQGVQLVPQRRIMRPPLQQRTVQFPRIRVVAPQRQQQVMMRPRQQIQRQTVQTVPQRQAPFGSSLCPYGLPAIRKSCQYNSQCGTGLYCSSAAMACCQRPVIRVQLPSYVSVPVSQPTRLTNTMQQPLVQLPIIRTSVQQAKLITTNRVIPTVPVQPARIITTQTIIPSACQNCQFGCCGSTCCAGPMSNVNTGCRTPCQYGCCGTVCCSAQIVPVQTNQCSSACAYGCCGNACCTPTNTASLTCPGGVLPIGRCSNGFCGNGYTCLTSLNICCQSTATQNSACPGNTQPAGSCVNGYCGSGLVCITSRNLCCPTTSGVTISTLRCTDGTEAAGACINGQCGGGYACVNNLCCKRSVQRQPRAQCPNGVASIGHCMSGLCPSNYLCSLNNLCCPFHSTKSAIMCPDGKTAVGPCDHGVCIAGQQCFSGVCCPAASCPNDQPITGPCVNGVCVTGKCIENVCCKSVARAPQKTIKSCPTGVPSAGPCERGACGGGLQCVRGVCCPPLESWICPNMESPVSVCVEDKCDGEGLICIDGACCPSKQNEPQQPRCSGDRQPFGSCRDDRDCPANYSCKGSICCRRIAILYFAPSMGLIVGKPNRRKHPSRREVLLGQMLRGDAKYEWQRFETDLRKHVREKAPPKHYRAYNRRHRSALC